MKKLKLFVLAFVFGTATIFASEKPVKTNTEIKNQVVNILNDAQFETYEDFNITLTFTFNQNGEIVVLGVNSPRKDIKDYIKKNVNLIKFENPGIENHKYTMPVKIKKGFF